MPRWVETVSGIEGWNHIDTSARVRWGECDVQGHAYYASYVPWFDLGREAFALAVGVDFWNYTITTTNFRARFHEAAKYLDDLTIRTWAVTPRRHLECHYEIYRTDGGRLLAEAHSVHSLVDPATGRLMRATDELHDKFEEFMERRRAQEARARG
ncbi:acyl-CoA thioesterase [Streptomyces sp. NPDC059070]|uniref:acyl-CoA thioesterase n=1 Tax=unclassified Streptomyces TaxID=2593676 RepID=UPI0034E1E8A7